MHLAIFASHPIQYQAPLFRALAKRPGVELEVIFFQAHGLHPSFDPGFGIEVRFDVPLTEGYAHRFLRNVSPWRRVGGLGQANPEVLTLLGGGRFDAALVHGYASPSALGLALAPRSCALLLRGDSNPGEPRSWAKRWMKAVGWPVLLARYDHFLAIGTANRDYYMQYGVAIDRITLAPFSVDNEYFARIAANKDRAELRSAWGLPLEGVGFVFCGKLLRKKRPQDALAAFARIAGRWNAFLAFAGDGAMRAELEQEAREKGLAGRVHFLGFQNQSKLPEIYAACDVLVLPSEIEPWGLVVNEAMACGAVPVVSDRVGCGPDLVAGAGRVFATGSVEGLAAAMEALLSRGELAAARERTKARIAQWGIEATANGVVEGVEKAIKARMTRGAHGG